MYFWGFPSCLATLKLGGPGQFSEKILAFYKRLWFMAKIAMESTGSAVIALCAEEEAKVLGICATTLRKWITYLIDNRVLIPLNRKGGRGRKALYRFQFPRPKVIHIKTQRQEAVGVSSYYSTAPYGQPGATSHEPQPIPASQENVRESPLPCPEGTDIPPKSSAAEDRAKKLKELPDDTPVVGKISNWVMEQVRHCCMDMGYTREESDILCNAFGRRIKGNSLGYARTLATWFRKHARWVLDKLREAARKGIRAVYAMLGFLFRKVLGILRPRPKRKPKATSPRWRWDLNDPKQRKAFVKLVEKIVKQGGGTCPRCGKRIRVAYWEQDAGLAFQDPDGCRCLYIAFDRDAREREQHDKLERETRQAETTPSRGPAHLGEVLGDLLGVRSGAGVLPLPPLERRGVHGASLPLLARSSYAISTIMGRGIETFGRTSPLTSDFAGSRSRGQ